MTYEHRPSGTPASPDIDMGLPEICERCDRDCPEPCEAFKRLEAVRTHLSKWSGQHSDWQMGRMSQWKKELDEIVEAEG